MNIYILLLISLFYTLINGLNVGTYNVDCVVICVSAAVESTEGADVIPSILPKHEEMKERENKQTLAFLELLLEQKDHLDVQVPLLKVVALDTPLALAAR